MQLQISKKKEISTTTQVPMNMHIDNSEKEEPLLTDRNIR